MDARAGENGYATPPSSSGHATPPTSNEPSSGEAAPEPAAPVDLPSLKACHDCSRIHIGANFTKVSPIRTFFGLFFVYTPILVLPFVLLGGCLVYVHLRLMGASNLKTLADFLPDWKSHRYRHKTQIVKDDVVGIAAWARIRAFWVFNCSLYCPISVAVLEWTTYLTKAVENWWCPFHHQKKENYATARLDYSYWHVSRDVERLHPHDRDNPIWNHEAAKGSPAKD